MKAVCGAKCDECELFKSNKCLGCKKTSGCPFGKKCWIAKYIEYSENNYEKFKECLIKEFNDLNIKGLPIINELYPLQGSLVNLEYMLPNEEKVRFLSDKEVYLGNQVECLFSDESIKSYYGLIANMNFLLVCEYKDGSNPEIIIYKKR